MMATNSPIALFPLRLFLLPGEQVELHVFEPRYKQLLRETERLSTPFGIAFEQSGTPKLGALVNLVKIKKRYPSGELDIVVEAVEIFEIQSFVTRMKHKLYPGGTVSLIELDEEAVASAALQSSFREFVTLTDDADNSEFDHIELSLLDMALVLSLTSEEKVRFVKLHTPELQERYLNQVMRYHTLLQRQELKTEFGLYLN